VNAKQGEAAGLRKTLISEKAKAERAEKELKDVKARLELHSGGKREVERKLEEMERETRLLKEDRAALADGVAQSEDKIKALQTMLSTVAEQYSQLWSRSVPREQYDEEKWANMALKLQVARLERKVGNAEEQVSELANFVRECRADKNAMYLELADTRERLEWMSTFANQIAHEEHETYHLETSLNELLLSERQTGDFVRSVESLLTSITSGLLSRYRHLSSDLLLHHTATFHLLNIESTEHEHVASKLSAVQDTVKKLQTEHDELTAQCASQESALSNMNARLEDEKAQRLAAERNAKTELSRMEGEVRRDKEVAQKMQSGMHQAKMAEEALKEEINKYAVVTITVNFPNYVCFIQIECGALGSRVVSRSIPMHSCTSAIAG
jgi:predicted  nucleic acid-binding Zn-ribbon protein